MAELTEITAVARSPRMGRPPLKTETVTVKTTVRLTEDVHSRIVALVGPNRMAVFIREAVERELDRREAEDR